MLWTVPGESAAFENYDDYEHVLLMINSDHVHVLLIINLCSCCT